MREALLSMPQTALPLFLLAFSVLAAILIVVAVAALRLFVALQSIEREVRNLSTVSTERQGKLLDALLGIMAPGVLKMVGSTVPPTSAPTPGSIPNAAQRAAADTQIAARQAQFSDEIAALINGTEGIYPERPPTPLRPPRAIAER